MMPVGPEEWPRARTFPRYGATDPRRLPGSPPAAGIAVASDEPPEDRLRSPFSWRNVRGCSRPRSKMTCLPISICPNVFESAATGPREDVSRAAAKKQIAARNAAAFARERRPQPLYGRGGGDLLGTPAVRGLQAAGALSRGSAAGPSRADRTPLRSSVPARRSAPGSLGSAVRSGPTGQARCRHCREVSPRRAGASGWCHDEDGRSSERIPPPRLQRAYFEGVDIACALHSAPELGDDRSRRSRSAGAYREKAEAVYSVRGARALTSKPFRPT
jgi:hypothetical protein